MIPRVVHQTGPSRILPALLQGARESMKLRNPTWAFKFYDDADVEEYIFKHYGRDYLSLYQSINWAYGAARADFFRYLVLYNEGGVYLDIKSTCTRRLDSILPPTVQHATGYWPSAWGWGRHPELAQCPRGEFFQWFIASAPKTQAMLEVILRVAGNIRDYTPGKYGVGKMGVLRTTGPIPYTQSLLPHSDDGDFLILDTEKSGLCYSVFEERRTHERFFDPHYSRLTSPVVWHQKQ